MSINNNYHQKSNHLSSFRLPADFHALDARSLIKDQHLSCWVFLIFLGEFFYRNILQMGVNVKGARFQKRAFSEAQMWIIHWVRILLVHSHMFKRCGVRKYNLKGGPLLAKKQNAFLQFYKIRFNASKSYLLTKKCSAYFCGSCM